LTLQVERYVLEHPTMANRQQKMRLARVQADIVPDLLLAEPLLVLPPLPFSSGRSRCMSPPSVSEIHISCPDGVRSMDDMSTSEEQWYTSREMLFRRRGNGSCNHMRSCRPAVQSIICNASRKDKDRNLRREWGGVGMYVDVCYANR